MFSNQVVFNAGLVRKGELKSASNGNSYLQLTVAKNYSVKEANGDWTNLEPIFVNLTVWGKEAELFDKSDVPLGSPLIIVGKQVGERTNAYTNSQGIQVPAGQRETIIVEGIGALIGKGYKVEVSKGNSSSTRTNSAPQQQTTKKENKPVNEVKEDSLFGSDNSTSNSSESLFGDTSDLFGGDDEFDDLFA